MIIYITVATVLILEIGQESFNVDCLIFFYTEDRKLYKTNPAGILYWSYIFVTNMGMINSWLRYEFLQC